MLSSTIKSETQLPVACFAPPLTENLLTDYRGLVEKLPTGEIKDILLKCLVCVEAWWKLPESTRSASQTLQFRKLDINQEIGIVPLEAEHVKSLWDVTPYPRETKGWGELLETLPNGMKSVGYYLQTGSDGIERMVEQMAVADPDAKELRDAAFHLLWHTIEIANDREPMTQDKLKEVGPANLGN